MDQPFPIAPSFPQAPPLVVSVENEETIAWCAECILKSKTTGQHVVSVPVPTAPKEASDTKLSVVPSKTNQM